MPEKCTHYSSNNGECGYGMTSAVHAQAIPWEIMPDYTLKGQLNDTFTILTVELLVSNTGMETEMTNPRPCYKRER